MVWVSNVGWVAGRRRAGEPTTQSAGQLAPGTFPRSACRAAPPPRRPVNCTVPGLAPLPRTRPTHITLRANLSCLWATATGRRQGAASPGAPQPLSQGQAAAGAHTLGGRCCRCVRPPPWPRRVPPDALPSAPRRCPAIPVPPLCYWPRVASPTCRQAMGSQDGVLMAPATLHEPLSDTCPGHLGGRWAPAGPAITPGAAAPFNPFKPRRLSLLPPRRHVPAAGRRQPLAAAAQGGCARRGQGQPHSHSYGSSHGVAAEPG